MIKTTMYCDICREEADPEKYVILTTQLAGRKNRGLVGCQCYYDVCCKCNDKISETMFELSRNGRDITK